MRDLVQQGVLDVRKVDTKDNPADIMTKPTKRETFLRHRDTLLSGTETEPDAAFLKLIADGDGGRGDLTEAAGSSPKLNDDSN